MNLPQALKTVFSTAAMWQQGKCAGSWELQVCKGKSVFHLSILEPKNIGFFSDIPEYQYR